MYDLAQVSSICTDRDRDSIDLKTWEPDIQDQRSEQVRVQVGLIKCLNSNKRAVRTGCTLWTSVFLSSSLSCLSLNIVVITQYELRERVLFSSLLLQHILYICLIVLHLFLWFLTRTSTLVLVVWFNTTEGVCQISRCKKQVSLTYQSHV